MSTEKPYKLHVWVYRNYAGCYEFATEAEAIADMEERDRKFGACHCTYAIEIPEQLEGVPV